MLYYTILCFLWAFLIAVFAIPSITYVAHIKQLLDVPNMRTIHQSLTPRLGGLAIFAGFSSALTIFGVMDDKIQKLLAGCIIIFFIGLKDDIVSVSAFKKFFVQILAAGVIMFMGDIKITNFYGVLGIYEIEEGISYLFTFFVIIGVTNAINLIDGLDGLAGVIIMIASFTFGIYFFSENNIAFTSYSYVAFCLLGAIVGFLRYNIYKAKIFMGDTGSLVCGLILSILAIQFIEMKGYHSEGVDSNAPAIAISILFIPILDTTRVFIFRILSGKSPFAPDRNHIHHRLLAIGLSQLTTVFTLGMINVGAISFAVFFHSMSSTNLIALLVAYALLISGVLELLHLRKKKSPLVNN